MDIQFTIERRGTYGYKAQANYKEGRNNDINFADIVIIWMPWIIENFGEYNRGARWKAYFRCERSVDDHITILFRNEEDAMAFKLQWA